MPDERIKRFEERQSQLAAMSDEQLKDRFWELSEQMMTPVVDLARTHTSPSIERSVLLRMGIDSVSTHGVVDKVAEAGLLGKGAGHCVLKVSHDKNVDLRTAAQMIMDDPSILDGLFARKEA